MRFAVSYVYRLGFSAWRRKSTILAAIVTLLLLLVCLQYSSFGGRTEGKIFTVEESTEDLSSGGKQRRVQFVVNQVELMPSADPSRLPQPLAREDLDGRHAFLQHYADDKTQVHASGKQDMVELVGPSAEGATQQSPYIPPQRIVHLDLKGAPPTVAYLKKIFPILAHLGATGILLEWEDVFPFSSITPLAAGNAYSRSDISAILASARSNDLEVIPLVQTFGHLEFALKHPEWSSLREDERVPTALCPSLNASKIFVERMLDEVISAHSVDGHPPKFVHIGCDEVFQLGECPRCRSTPRERLFLSHVTHVAAIVKSRFGSTPIIWDDMLRHVSPEAMRESGLGSLVEPMVWVYAEDVYRFVPPGVWDKYAAIFNRVWAASAFKGAFGETLYVPNAKRHLDNNLRWLDVISRESPKFKGGFHGLVLTGWQRYDHFAVLCELLPAAMPSLAMSLLTVTRGRFDASLRKDIHAALSCPETGIRDPTGSSWADLSGDPFLWDRFSRCLFPGALLYRLTARLQATEREFSALVEAVHHRRGWMTPYNVRHNFSSPLRVEEVAGMEQVARLQQSVENLIRSARDSLVDILDPFAISEWIEQRLYPMVTELDSIAKDAAVLKSKRTWPVRPLPPLEELRRFGVTVPPLPTMQQQLEEGSKKEH